MLADGLAELGAYLLAPDRVPLELLHALPWQPILQLLAPVTRAQPAALDAAVRLWATQLTLLALQALMLLPSEHLPEWLLGLIGQPQPAGTPGQRQQPHGGQPHPGVANSCSFADPISSSSFWISARGRLHGFAWM